MDESKPSIPWDKIIWPPASDGRSAVIDPSASDSANSEEFGARERQSRSDQSEFCRDNSADALSVVVYCGSEEKVNRGFLVALRAMGVPVLEQASKPANPPVARVKP
jgi:hypothetical protein